MTDLVHVLLVEDDEDDFLLTRSLLADGFGNRFRLDWVDSPAEALEKLTTGSYDVALVDYHLGGTTGTELLRRAHARGSRIPVIMLTGQCDRATDIDAMHAGAADFLVKGRVTGDMLERAIRYARERHRLLEEISALSLTDELTGLNNRRAFMTMADQRLQLLERNRSLLVLIFADVDGLKHVNDTLGHDAGDALIIAAANVLRLAFRRTDLIARLGGDEFIVLAEIASEEAAGLLLAKLQEHIDAWNAEDSAPAPLSISAGVLSFRASPGVKLQNLIAEADLRMLQCKTRRRGTRAQDAEPEVTAAAVSPRLPAAIPPARRTP
jgi:two-component system, cell cycle response regulator